jgi:phage gp46-like protein
VTIDQILHFFSQHNVAIIEGLVAAIILLGLFVGYRGFFGKKDAESSLGGGLDTAQLEKTLQKILDSQGHAPKSGDDALAAAFKDGAAGHPESPEEVQQLKVSLNENIKELEVIRAELQIAEKKVAELQSNPAAGGGEAQAAAPAVDTSELDNKIKDLEARLAEYEIISEDIADLSRYKEENEQLKTEITGLKQAPAAAPVAAAPAPTPVAPVAEAAPAPAPTPEPVVAVEPAVTEADVDAALAAAQAEAATPAAEPTSEVAATEAAPAESESIIDDELMREFAAAVEGQKNKDLDSVADKAGKGEAAEGKSAEDSQLMDEFENFVNKKS